MKKGCIIAVLMWGVFLVPGVYAADTVETWDVGATDVDFYIGMEGVGRGKMDRGFYTDMMLGYGLIPGLSSYLGVCLEGDGVLSGGSTLYAGVFGTVIDSDHFDVDVFFDTTLEGALAGVLTLTPAVELNFDVKPDLEAAGVYLRFGLPVHAGEDADGVKFHLEGTAGFYWTLSEGHQVLLEYSYSIHPFPPAGKGHVESGTVALGYNVCISEALELITEVHASAPWDSPGEVGVMVGFIATLPSVQE